MLRGLDDLILVWNMNCFVNNMTTFYKIKNFHKFSKFIEYLSKLDCLLKTSNIHLSTSIQVCFTTNHSGKMCSIVSGFVGKDI